MVYQQENMQMHEFATMAVTWMFLDPVSGTKHQLNTNLKVNNFATTVVDTILYEGGHSHWEGMETNLNGYKMVSLLTTENLEVTVRPVTIWEGFNTGDIVVIKHGVSILAALW